MYKTVASKVARLSLTRNKLAITFDPSGPATEEKVDDTRQAQIYIYTLYCIRKKEKKAAAAMRSNILVKRKKKGGKDCRLFLFLARHLAFHPLPPTGIAV